MPTPLPPSTGDPLAVPELGIERIGESGDRELLGDHRPFAGAGTAQTHIDVLVAQLGWSFVLLEILAQLRLGRLQFRRERLTDLGALAHQHDVVLEPLLLVVVQGGVALTLFGVADLRLGVGGESAAM